MGEKLKKFVAGLGQGMAQGMVISPDRAYLRPENRSFRLDNANLNGDVRKIGSGLKKKLKETEGG
jgi:hypothetical protein